MSRTPELILKPIPNAFAGIDVGKTSLDFYISPAGVLVAEIGSAFLCAELGITQDTRADHAQYIAHWIQLLKGDPKAIFTAATKASQAIA